MDSKEHPFPPLADLLDESVVALRCFKDKLDQLPDAPREVAFSLAWPEHPNFETLIDEMGKWADSLRTHTEEDFYQVATLDDLLDQYQAFMDREGLKLGSADEHIFDESLTEKQRKWVASFSNRWDVAERCQDDLCLRLKIESTQKLSQYRVNYDGDEYPLLGFAMVNSESPEVLDQLLSSPPGTPVQIPVHAGYEEITLLHRQG